MVRGNKKGAPPLRSFVGTVPSLAPEGLLVSPRLVHLSPLLLRPLICNPQGITARAVTLILPGRMP